MIEKIALFFKNILDWLKLDNCIFRYFFDALKITNNSLILATPLILFILFASTYLILSPVNKVFNIAFVLFLFFAMTAAFFSGWFYTIKLAVEDFLTPKTLDVVVSDEGNDAAPTAPEDMFYLIKQFPVGVAHNFVPFFFMVVLFFIMLTGVIFFSYKSAYLLIGSVGITRPELFFALSSPDAMRKLVTSLTIDQQIKLSYWNLYFLFTTTFYSFLVMFWAPEIIYSEDSVLKDLLHSISKLFKKFFRALMMFAFLMLVYFVISLLSTWIRLPLLQFLMTVIYFYFLVYAAVLVFLFYKKEFTSKED